MMKGACVWMFVFGWGITAAQHHIGVCINAGTSHLTTGHLTATTFFRPSASLGLYYTLKSNSLFFFNIGLAVSQIEGREHDQRPETTIVYDTLRIKYSSDTWIDRHLTYLTLPVTFGMKFGRFEPAFGFQLSKLLYSAMDVDQVITEDGVEYPNKSRQEHLYVDPYDLGLVVSLGYHLSNRINMDLFYYHGTNNIHGFNYFPLSNVVAIGHNPWYQKVRQLTVGIKYRLYKGGQKNPAGK